MRLLRCPNPYCVTVYAQPFMLRPFLGSILNGQPFKLLQRAINDLLPTDKWVTVDGKLGRQTLIATKTLDPHKLALRLCDRREEKYYAIVRANPTQRKFLKGWLNRLNDLRREIRSKP
jgi:lysozyme family protein